MADRWMVWSDQPLVAAWAAIATRLGSSVSSQVRAGAGGRGGRRRHWLSVRGEPLVRQVEGELYTGVQPPGPVALVEPVGVVGECPAECGSDVHGDQFQRKG